MHSQSRSSGCITSPTPCSCATFIGVSARARCHGFPITSILRHKVYLPYVRRIRVVRALNYVPYVKADAMQLLQTRFGWQPYPQKHFESRFTQFYESYWLPKKFGYDMRRVQYSSLILTKQMTRDEALAKLEQPPYDAATIHSRHRVRREQARHLRRRAAGLSRGAEQVVSRLPLAREHLCAGSEGHAAGGSGTGRKTVIAIVDYGLGNVAAISQHLQEARHPGRARGDVREGIGTQPTASSSPASASFDWAMDRLNRSGHAGSVWSGPCSKSASRYSAFASACKCSLAGARKADLPGFGWIDGRGQALRSSRGRANARICRTWAGTTSRPIDVGDLFATSTVDARFYFLHSYYFEAANPANVLAVTDYNGRFASGVRSANVFGVQFHPEKSHQWGVRLLKNFAEL